MANIDNILEELQKADEYNEKIENEMNNILKESDCVLIKAETQLNGIIINDTFKIIEEDFENSSASSYALSIEVSRELFKEFDDDHDISAIYPTSVDNIPSSVDNIPSSVDNIPSSVDNIPSCVDNIPSCVDNIPSSVDNIPSSINNIPLIKLPDVIDEVQNSQEFVANTLIENDANKNNDTMGCSLEITITNDAGDDNETDKLETTLLNNSSTFKGCSEEFALNGVEEKITVTVGVEEGRLVLGSLTEHTKLEENTISQETPSTEAVIDITVDGSKNKETITQKIKLKRPNEDNNPSEDNAKKVKLDERNTEFDETLTEYTQILFDPDETADANDPKWSQFNNNLSIEEHFEYVRKQWRTMSLPNPHKNLTTRFVPAHRKYKSETAANTANEYGCMSCVQYLDNKINRYTQKVNELYVRLNYLPLSNRGRSQRNKILREIDELQKFVIEIVKNREEIQQNFRFYQHPNNTWDARYLTRTQLDELKEQERLLEFQKRFYSG